MNAEPGSPPDSTLIRRFLGGEERAFRRLYQRHTPRLRMLVLRLVGYRDDVADDVVQDTWLACCRSLSGFRGASRFDTWLTTIGIRTARRHMASAFDGAEALAGDGDGVSDPTAGSAAIEASIDAERLLRRLSDRARIVFTLHVLEGMPHDDIARELCVTAGTSRAILSRAVASLRAHLHGRASHDP